MAFANRESVYSKCQLAIYYWSFQNCNTKLRVSEKEGTIRQLARVHGAGNVLGQAATEALIHIASSMVRNGEMASEYHL